MWPRLDKDKHHTTCAQTKADRFWWYSSKPPIAVAATHPSHERKADVYLLVVQ